MQHGFEWGTADERHARTWWLREAQRHVRAVRACSLAGLVEVDRRWHLEQASTARRYAREIKRRAFAREQESR